MQSVSTLGKTPFQRDNLASLVFRGKQVALSARPQRQCAPSALSATRLGINGISANVDVFPSAARPIASLNTPPGDRRSGLQGDRQRCLSVQAPNPLRIAADSP